MTDRDIIDLYIKRDERAIAESQKKYEDYCYSVAMRILGDSCDAEECVNDTWFIAWERVPIEKPDNLGAYLSRITHNTAVARLRKQTAEKRGGGEMPLVFEELSECLPGSDGADSPVLLNELAASVNRFYETLPKKHRAIFVARYYSARSFAAIASAAGTSEANVRMILSRTRKKLREHLEKEGLI